jgi:ligand-binding sensor domain-containing protein/signal transduction histidine kinase
VAVLGAAALPAAAERLAIRAYTTADGLPSDHIQCVVPDSRGFLWLCTSAGLSRFDGRRFVTYGPAHGLREPYVNDFLETRAGVYWIATNGAGVFRFDPATSRFEPHPVGADTASGRVNALLEDAAGALWAGSDDGLFRRSPAAGGFAPVALPVPPGRVQVRALARDAAGAVWIASSVGLFRAADGTVEQRAPEVRNAFSAMSDREGRLWAGHASGLLVLDASGRRLTHPDGLELATFTGEAARSLLQRADGGVLVGGRNERGLVGWDGRRRRDYTTAHGLSDTVVTALAEDPRGNLWIGTETGGVMRLAKDGFVTYGTADGLGHRRVVSIFETRAGELCVLTALRVLNRFHGAGFTAVRPRSPVPPTALTVHSMAQDRTGGWWAANPAGLARYAPADGLDQLARADPVALYTVRDGLARDDTGRPFGDARGDLWITVGGTAALTRWERSTGTFHHYGQPEGLPAGNLPVAFGEDVRGRLWVGFREGGVARRDGERFRFFGTADGVPAFYARSLHRDARGRLWLATTGGGLVEIVDTPGRPRFRRFTTADGLSTDHIRCLTDDGQGRLYLGTAVGVDRFDPESREIRRFTTTDGLAQNEIQAAYRDRHGALWFGTMNGVSRLVAGPHVPPPAAPAMIAAVSVAGMPLRLSALGERAVPEFAIGPGPAAVRIEYFVTDFTPGRERLFEYRLADAAWSAPTTRDAVDYAALSPGRYLFEVRAAGDGLLPATVAFVVRPPVWQRGWFVALVASVLAALAWRFHRSRVERALLLERVRTRIATDLHDDIGANLSQIAIWSEVAARGGVDAALRERLSGIASACRETVDSMSDIVWAINPAHDRLSDLVHRMRRFATDAFTARDVAFTFEAQTPDELTLGTDVRRQVLLVFKEAVHNAVRHSGCRAAEVRIAVAHGVLRLVVSDDGKGFDPAARRDGHGLDSMSARARGLGADLDVRSAPGQGTTVTLVVPHLRK